MPILNLLQDRIAQIGAIAGVLVTLNGGLTTCSNDRANRYAGFRAAVASEEAFWKDRFADYSADVAIKDPEERHGKMMALAALSQHPVPMFEEYSFGPFASDSPKKAAEDRLANLRRSLMKALINDRDREVAELVRQSADFEQSEQAVKPESAASAAVPAPQKVQPAVRGPSLETQVLGIGPAEGWDVDVFWCTTDSDAANMDNYNYAKTVATRLGAIASQQVNLGPGVRLGRVQLRPLPQLVQGSGDYPVRGSGNTLLVDDESGEKDAAAALLKVLVNVGANFSQSLIRDGSKDYMSAFVCGTAPLPAPVADSADTAASQTSPGGQQGDVNGSMVRPGRGAPVPRGSSRMRGQRSAAARA